jgi:hypothetical protein
MINSYKLAEKLSERLDEMGKDLTSMIEEVNGASSTLSKTNKADEPVCQYVPLVLHLIHLLTRPYRSLKSSAFSTHTCPNCRSSIKAPLNCRARSLQPKRQASRSLPVSDTDTTTLAWAMTTPLMTSTAPSCKGGKLWTMVFFNDLNSELLATWHLDVLWGMYYCSQDMLIVGHNKLFACSSVTHLKCLKTS